jgi:soluble lytic murein transglycosylase
MVAHLVGFVKCGLSPGANRAIMGFHEITLGRLTMMGQRETRKQQPLALLLISALLLTACAERATPSPTPEPTPTVLPSPTATVTVTATATPPPSPTPTTTATVTSTPTLTPTPTHTPEPTPTPLVVRHWQEGYVHQHNGDYARAIAAYQALLASQPKEDEAQEARFRLGEVYLLDKDYPQAIEALQQFLDDTPESEQAPQAAFLLATAHKELGHWEEAIKHYNLYRTQEDLIADQVGLLIAEAYMELERYPESLAEYQAVLDLEGTSPSLILDALESMAEAHLQLEDYEQAIATYERALARVGDAAHRAQIEYAIALAYRDWDQEDRALERFRRVVEKTPQTPEAYWALGELLAAGERVDDRQRGMVYYYNADYEAAIAALHRHMDTDPDHKGDVHYYAALAYQWLGRHPQAIRELDVLIETHPQSERLGQAWMAKARSQRVLGVYTAALETYRRFVNLHPDDPLADDALWQAAWLTEAWLGCGSAAEDYLDLAQAYPQREHAAQALFRAGLCTYILGQYEKAEDPWLEVAAHSNPDLKSQGFFWLGKASLAQGDEEESKEYLAQAAAAAPTGYYGLRAGGLDSQEARESEEEQDMEEWLLAWADPGGDWVATLREDRSFRRGEELLAVGLREAALAEFKALQQRVWEDPQALYRLALLFRELGLYRLSIACAERIATLSPSSSPSDAPRALQQLSYPRYFDDLVAAEAGEWNLDPLLLLALIRQESRFDPWATSWAGARGLTQVIPTTGEFIAWQLKLDDYQTEDLYRPYLSVRFGAAYLAAQLAGFDDQVPLALAAYNGGPGNARRWAEEAADMDLAVEEIDLNETQLYVRRVYEHYATYGGSTVKVQRTSKSALHL